jgi:hypothetical protein
MNAKPASGVSGRFALKLCAMAEHKGAPQPIGHHIIELGPPVADRVALGPKPGASTVEFYFLTDAANRAWQTINASLAARRSALFWVSGPPGAGKTHFLNYVLALEERSGTTTGRSAVLRLEFQTRVGADEIERRLFEALANAIGAESRSAGLWRQMRGAEALDVALGQARRVGFRSVTVALDFSESDSSAPAACLAEFTRAVAPGSQTSFNTYVAARAAAPAGAQPLDVAPSDADEQVLAALARARRVIDEAAAAALYRNIDTAGFEPSAIFPFHPITLKTLRAISGASAGVAAMARLVSEILTAHRDGTTNGYSRPVLPGELIEIAGVARRVDEKLGQSGRAALKVAHSVAQAMEDRELAHQLVNALMLEQLGGAQTISLRELRVRAPAARSGRQGAAAPIGAAAVGSLLAALAERSGGVIALDARGAQFNPRAAGAPEVAAFNAALPLIRRFDSTLSAAADSAELRTRLKRFGEAMANVLEGAHHVASILEAAAREMRIDIAPEQRRTLDDFFELVGSGVASLVELGAEPSPREQAARVVAAYEVLAVAAAAMPRIRAMREYLGATGLKPDLAADERAVDKAVAALEVECQLLLAALNADVTVGASRNFDALEARFQKFKWTYVQLYRAAHEHWRRESERLASMLDDARMHFAALARLNSIAALGPPLEAETGARIEELGRGITQCPEGGPTALEITPRCPQCAYALGTPAPKLTLDELLDRVERALKEKLSTLSQGAIARLIRQHDGGHRLDGFLKITQAAHTDALVRVLDDNLARYLGQLLEEIGEEAKGVVKPFARPGRSKLRAGSRPDHRPLKPPH